MNKLLFFFLLIPFVVCAGPAGVVQDGDYEVNYSVFNSTLIPPEVAKHYPIVRGKDRALVNVALLKKQGMAMTLGQKAKVTGSANNLLGQSFPLEFVEINEGEAIYYLANLRFDHLDIYHFKIEVQPEADKKIIDVKFSHKLYQDDK